jgi:hypothetical protein
MGFCCEHLKAQSAMLPADVPLLAVRSLLQGSQGRKLGRENIQAVLSSQGLFGESGRGWETEA